MQKSNLISLAQADDPKAALFQAVGDLSKYHVFSGRVLLGIYVGPEKMKSGLYRPQTNIREDIYQGTCALVLKIGPLAFEDDDTHKFRGQKVSVGDWVMFRPGDATRLQIKGVNCRLIDDVLIQMIIPDPEAITYDTV